VQKENNDMLMPGRNNKRDACIRSKGMEV